MQSLQCPQTSKSTVLALQAYSQSKSQKMNPPSRLSTTLALQPRLEASGVAVVPYSEAEDEAGAISVEDGARSRTREWAAVAVNRPTYTTNEEVLEADEVGGDSAGKIMTSLNGIVTPL